MKRIIGIVVVALLLMGLLPLVGVAQQPTTSSALSPQDAANAKDGLNKLGVVFGVKPPQETGEAPAKEEHKTVGDAADKALDLVSKAVASISATLEKVAPHVWKIMIKQQYAKAVGDLIVPVGSLFLTLLYWQIVRKSWKEEGIREGSDQWYGRFWLVRGLPFGAGFIFAIWTFVNLSHSVMMLINPEYYAVRDIITMLLGQAPQ